MSGIVKPVQDDAPQQVSATSWKIWRQKKGRRRQPKRVAENWLNALEKEQPKVYRRLLREYRLRAKLKERVAEIFETDIGHVRGRFQTRIGEIKIELHALEKSYRRRIWTEWKFWAYVDPLKYQEDKAYKKLNREWARCLREQERLSRIGKAFGMDD